MGGFEGLELPGSGGVQVYEWGKSERSSSVRLLEGGRGLVVTATTERFLTRWGSPFVSWDAARRGVAEAGGELGVVSFETSRAREGVVEV